MPKRPPKGDRRGTLAASSSSAANSDDDERSSNAGSNTSNDGRAKGEGGRSKKGGEKRRIRKGGSSDSLEFLDAGAEESDGRWDDDGEDREPALTWEEELRLLVDDGLTERRTSTREASLAKVVNLLSQHYAKDVLAQFRFSLLDALKQSLKREAKESALASKALGVLFASLGPGQDDLFHEVTSSLRAAILSGSSPLAKAEAIRALGTASFVNHTLPEEIGEVLNMLQRFLDSTDSSREVHLSALDMHGLLYTTLPESSDLRQETFDRTMDSHMSLMGSKHPDVRIAAGENIAIMYELLRENENTVHYDNYNELLDHLSELATESGKQKSKKEKSAQKAAFRSIISSIDGGERPSTKLQFQDRNIRIEGFARLRQLATFKELLGEGLHIHFVENQLFHDVFGVEFSDAGAGRAFRSGADSRARTRDIKAGRAGKAREIDLVSDY